MSPGGTVIRPPPGPPPVSPRKFSLVPGLSAGETRPVAERPEEPAKFQGWPRLRFLLRQWFVGTGWLR